MYQEWEDKKLLLCNSKRHRQGSLDLCELLTIVLYFIYLPAKILKIIIYTIYRINIEVILLFQVIVE